MAYDDLYWYFVAFDLPAFCCKFLLSMFLGISVYNIFLLVSFLVLVSGKCWLYKNEIWKCSSQYFGENIEKDWFSFFECLVEGTIKVLQIWSSLFFNYKFYFLISMFQNLGSNVCRFDIILGSYPFLIGLLIGT